MIPSANVAPDYYTSMTPKLMKSFETMFSCAKKPAGRYLDACRLQEFHEQARKEFEKLIPQLPYIGGKKVPGTRNLVGGAQMLAMIRSLERYGLSREQIGEVIYGTWERLFGRIPRFASLIMGKIMMSGIKNRGRSNTCPISAWGIIRCSGIWGSDFSGQKPWATGTTSVTSALKKEGPPQRDGPRTIFRNGKT